MMRGHINTNHGDIRRRRLPVFVSPEELRFIGDEESSHRQILTIFNPYDFIICFKVLSNAPHKYSVIESQGTVNPRCCIDLNGFYFDNRVVCHRLATDGPYNVTDRFKIELFHDRRGSSRLIGWKLVVSTLLEKRSGLQNFEMSSDGMKDFVSPAASVTATTPSSTHLPHTTDRGGSSVLLVLTAIICLIILLLPLQGEQEHFPSYLHLTVNQKLIAAFALGLLTMAILKS